MYIPLNALFRCPVCVGGLIVQTIIEGFLELTSDHLGILKEQLGNMWLVPRLPSLDLDNWEDNACTDTNNVVFAWGKKKKKPSLCCNSHACSSKLFSVRLNK